MWTRTTNLAVNRHQRSAICSGWNVDLTNFRSWYLGRQSVRRPRGIVDRRRQGPRGNVHSKALKPGDHASTLIFDPGKWVDTRRQGAIGAILGPFKRSNTIRSVNACKRSPDITTSVSSCQPTIGLESRRIASKRFCCLRRLSNRVQSLTEQFAPAHPRSRLLRKTPQIAFVDVSGGHRDE